MKVNPLRSITAKLFYLSVLLVAGTVGLLAFQQSQRLKEVLENQVMETSSNQAEKISDALNGVLDSWRSQLTGVIRSMVRVNSIEDKQRILSDFMSNGEDYVGIQVFDVYGSKVSEAGFVATNKTEDAFFSKKNPDKVIQRLRKLNTKRVKNLVRNKNYESIKIQNISHMMKLPMLNLTMTVSSSTSARRIVIVLTVWQVQFTQKLVESQLVRSLVLDDAGRLISTRSTKELLGNKNYSSYGIVKSAIGEGDLGGYNLNYKADGVTWVGAFYKIPLYGLIVIRQQDHESAYSDVRQALVEMVLYGSLFIMVAVLASFLGAQSMTKNLREVIGATWEISRGDFDYPIHAKTSDEVGYLAESIHVMAVKIKALLESQVAKAHIDNELKTAQAVQDTIFPKPDRENQILNVSGYSIPASQTGGDWWGHYSTDKGIEYVFVADAMGHGVPAALVTAMAYSGCMTLVHLITESKEVCTPGVLLEELNRVIVEAVEGTISMTFFAMMIDYNRGEVTFANAGHNFPLMVPADPNDDRIVGKKNRSLSKISPLSPVTMKEKGVILGVKKDAVFSETTMKLKPGDKFLLYSDGLIECKSPKGKMWGSKGLREKLMTYIDGSTEEIKNALVREAFDFFEDTPRDDDLTVVVVEFPPDAKIGGYSDEEGVESVTVIENSLFQGLG